MTEREQPNPDGASTPASNQPTEKAPTPPPSPYETPSQASEEPSATSPAAAYPPPTQQFLTPQSYPQQPYTGQPYSQQPYPGQPQQPYTAYGEPQSSSQQPPYYPPPYPYGTQPPFPPYSGGQPYPNPAEPPSKKKVWPWVLGVCLAVFLLGIGGCVSCTAVAAIIGAQEYRDSLPYLDSYDNYDYGYENGDSDTMLGTFTLDEIKEAYGDVNNSIVDGRCSTGVYTVGDGQDLQPGTYFLEGSQTEEMNFYVFEATEDGSYKLGVAVTYFGNYFTELNSGDVIAFVSSGDALFYPLTQAEFTPKAPYQSGLYRVGTDLPAGTYTITSQNDAAAVAENDSAAFVMKDLAFSDDSITETKYVIRGSSQTVTVKNGDYLELYAATAKPSNPAA